jgi:hypothetical protein
MKKNCKIMLAGCALAIAAALPATAQPATTAQSATGGNGVLQLPPGVEQLVSIDAHNILLAQLRDPDNPDRRSYAVIVPQHVYSGGLARLFGGTVIPTEQFLVPGGALNSGPRGGVLSVQSNNPLGGSANGGNFNNGFNLAR